MGKNNSRRRNHKPFNPICNAEKLQELRAKLRKLESDNNGRGPKASSPPSEEKKKENFSEKDHEIVLSIREMFAKDGKKPEYREGLNTIRFPANGNLGTHHLFISCYSNVLKIVAFIDYNNSSNGLLNHIMKLNFKIQMGSFCCNIERDYLIFNLGVPLYGELKKGFIGSIIKYTVDVLDDCVPEIISCIHETNHWKKEGVSPAFH